MLEYSYLVTTYTDQPLHNIDSMSLVDKYSQKDTLNGFQSDAMILVQLHKNHYINVNFAVSI